MTDKKRKAIRQAYLRTRQYMEAKAQPGDDVHEMTVADMTYTREEVMEAMGTANTCQKP